MDEFEIKSYLLRVINTTPRLIGAKLKYEYKYLRQRKEFFELKSYVDNFLEKLGIVEFNNNSNKNNKKWLFNLFK